MPRSELSLSKSVASTSTLVLVLLLVCCCRFATAQLALTRPDGDCLAPALTSLKSGISFFPSSYQLQSIQAPAAASSSGLSTTVKFASDFTVTYYGTFKIVNNTRAGEVYLLYQCGTPNPQASNTELDLPPNTKVFEVPLVSVAVTDSNAAAFLAELGLTDRVAFASKYSYNACLQAINECGGTAVSASNDSTTEWQQLSAAQQPKVDAIFTGDKTANPKSIAVTSYADPGVLNRAEWVKFVAVFFNKEVEANKLFNDIVTNYQQLNASARAAAAGAANPTRVAWTNKFGDTLTLSYAVYKKEYMTDAGGKVPAVADIIAAGGAAKTSGSNTNYNFNASVPAQRAGFFSILQDVDIIFDESYTVAASNLLDMAAFKAAYGAEASTLPAVTNGQVYVFNNRLAKSADNTISTDWFETATARPDLALKDFVKVITPSAAPEGTTSLTWLRQLPAAGVTASNGGLSFTSAGACTSITSAGSAANRCQRPDPARICPNAYRDCATGELKTVTDPTQRCTVRTTCAEPSSTNTTAAKRNAAGLTKSASWLVALCSILLVVLAW